MRYVIRRESFGYLVYDQFAQELTIKTKINDFSEARVINNFSFEKLSAPLTVFLELTTLCNLRCKHCFHNDRISHNSMLFEQAKAIIDQLYERGIVNIKISGGEPFLNPDFLKILTYLDEKKINYIVYTNGLFIDENVLHLKKLKFLSYIRVSMDGPSEINDSIRGEGTFYRTILGIKRLEKEDIPCQINFTITNSNYVSIEDFCLQLKEEHKIKSKIHVGFVKISGLAKENLQHCFTDPDVFEKQILEIKDSINNCDNIDEFKLLPSIYFKLYGNRFGCPAGRTTLTIKSNGDVFPCGLFSGNEEFNCGNILQQSLINIWNSKKMKDFRNIPIATQCKNCDLLFRTCTGGCRANAYHMLGHLYAADINCMIYRYFGL